MTMTPMKGRPPPATPGRSPRRASDPSPVRPRAAGAGTTPARRAAAEAQENTQGGEGIQVAIRMRPLNNNEGSHSRVWKVLPKYKSVAQTTVEGKPLPERVMGRNFFTYDKTFGEDCSTATVYEKVAQNIVQSVCTGLNGTVFAYGQTSSGKTYTMQGSGTIAEGSDGSGGGGIVHMAAQDVFRHIAEQSDRLFLVRASFLEIYNEEVRDLLNDNRALQVREDPRRGVFVQSKEEIVTDFNSLLQVLFTGEKSRAFASTAMNERSSRSHTIFRITIESRHKEENDEEGAVLSDGDDGAVRVSTLNLVDLAGSESVRHTGATGDRQKEGGMINQSLLTLSRVIVALGTPNQGHINFRDSKLTRILQPSLSGNARMAVVCCATPSELYLEETRSTLLFASRAKLVKTNAQVNEVLDDRSIIRRLQRELAEARRHGGGAAAQAHVRALEHKAEEAGTAVREAEGKLKRLYASILNNDGGLFRESSSTDVENSTTQPNKRRRRFSDGNFTRGGSTPTRDAIVASVPQTNPRPLKTATTQSFQWLSPSAELSMLRQALAAKTETISSMAKDLGEASKNLQDKDMKLLAANCAIDQLNSDRDNAIEKTTALASEIEKLNAELETASKSREEIVKVKDLEIVDKTARLEKELDDRRVLEETVDTLQEAKGSLEQDLATLKASSKAQIGELEDQVNQQRLELQSKTAYSDDLSNTNTKHISRISELEQELVSQQEDSTRNLELAVADKAALQQELDRERDSVKDLQSSLEKATTELSESRAENDAAVDRIKTLGQQLGDANATVDSLKQSNNELETKLVELASARDESARVAEKHAKEEAESQKKLAFQSEQLQQLTEQLEDTTRQLAEEHTAKGSAEDQVSTLGVDLEKANEQVVSLEGTIISIQGELANEKQQNAELKLDLESKSETMRQLSTSLEDTLLELTETRSAKESAEAQVSKLNEELTVASEQRASLEADITSLREEASRGMEQSQLDKDALQNDIDSKNEQIQQLEASLEESNSELSSAREANGSAQEEVRRLRDELATAAAEIESVEGKLIALQEESALDAERTDADKAALQKELESKSKQVLQLTTSLDDAASELSETRAAKESTEAKVSDLSEELAEASSTMESLEATFANFREEATREAQRHAADAAVLRKEFESKVEQVQQLEKRVKDAATQIADLKAVKETVDDQFSSLSCELSKVKTEFESLKQTKSNLEGELNAAKTANESARAELEHASAVLSDSTQLKEKLEISLQEQNSELEATNKKLAASLQELEELRQDADTLKASLAESSAARAMFENQVTSLTEENIANGQAISRLNETITGLESSVGTLEQERETLTEKINVLEDAVTNAERERDTMKATVDAAEESLKKAEARINTITESTRTELESANAEIQNKIDDLACAQSKVDELTNALSLRNEELQRKTESESISSAAITKLTQTAEEHQTIVDGLTVVLGRAEQQFSVLADERNFEREEFHRMSEVATAAERTIGALTNTLQTVQGDAAGLRIALGQSEEQITYLMQERDTMQEETKRLSTEKKGIETSKEALNTELQAARDDLIRTHDILETTNMRYNETKQRISDLEDELESKETMLSHGLATVEVQRDQLEIDLDESRSEYKELLGRFQELLAEKTELEKSLSEKKEANPATKSAITQLQTENKELKLLLAGSNRSIEEAREAADAAVLEAKELESRLKLSQQQLERVESELNSALADACGERKHDSQHQDDLQNRLQQVLAEKQQVDRTLEEERTDRARSEADLKRLMGEEQRALVHDAEQTMGEFRAEITQLQQAVRTAEAEAYASRQMKEELEDQRKHAVDRSIQLESKISSLENENTRLRRASARHDSDRDAEITTLRSSLQKEKAERLATQKSISALEKKVEETKANEEAATRNLAHAQEQLSRLNERGLVAENLQLQAEIKRLQTEITDLKSDFHNNLCSVDEVNELRAQLAEKNRKIRSRDERIQKLEKKKLTKERVKQFQDCQKEKVKLQEELEYAKGRIASLQSQLSSSSSGPEDSELTKLRFDNEALEKKIRKFAVHCQHLEDDKENIMQTLGLKNAGDDISKAIVTLCDKLASLEKECDSLAKSESRASVSLVEVEQLREKNSSLKSQIAEYQKKIDKLVRSEVEQKETVASLRRELEELRELAERARGNAASVESEKAGQLRYLEQENLNLIVDLKAAKKKLQDMKAEINMLRAQGAGLVSDSTPLPPQYESESKTRTSSHSRGGTPATKRPKTPAKEKENSTNSHAKKSVKSKPPRDNASSTRRSDHRLGLGDAYAASEENTTECKQS